MSPRVRIRRLRCDKSQITKSPITQSNREITNRTKITNHQIVNRPIKVPDLKTDTPRRPIMPPRPTWKGYLKVSLVNIPVKVYPATEASATISFNQLHAECQTR